MATASEHAGSVDSVHGLSCGGRANCDHRAAWGRQVVGGGAFDQQLYTKRARPRRQFLRHDQGYILPWLPQSHRQNTVIIEAAAATAGRLTEVCSVIYDGVLGPWFLPAFIRATGLAYLHYVILLPPLEVCLERVQTRVDHAFRDQSATRELYEQFAHAAVDSRHLITKPDHHPAELAELISQNLDDGRFRYSAP